MTDGAWNTTADDRIVHEADAVFEGGGVKGVALVGALQGFKARGYTDWKNVAGTSAGAILAAYIACGHNADDALNVIANAPYESFQDWGRGGKIFGGAFNLIHEHGLCHGKEFETWMDKQLGGATFADVKNKDTNETRLKMVATDITRQKMLVLPEDLPDFIDPDTGRPFTSDTFNIARAVRMSMSIPYFFSPVKMKSADGQDCIILDGGVLSNFPVWLFDVNPDADPTRPTFGFRITGGRGVGSGLNKVVATLGWPVEEGAAIFHTSSGAWDERFASHSTIVRTCPAPAGDLGTTDFGRVNDVKDKVIAGAEAAAGEFLDGFKLKDYRNTHAKTIK